jgi:predicted transcriptional regulator of viral defense system
METKKNISYLAFRDFFSPLGCFSTYQVKIWNEQFDRNNFGRWEKQGKLIRLRQGYYTFPSYKGNGDAPYYFANKIYPPSYVSLHSALSFYGMIPEGVVHITSVTSRKTARFQNPFGEFIYQSIKPQLMFGYSSEKSSLTPTWNMLLASPEKALLDLLYLNPQYNSETDMQELRLDIDFMQEELNVTRLDEYLSRFASKALETRVACLKGAYI